MGNRKRSRQSYGNQVLNIFVKKEIDELATLFEMTLFDTLVICICNPPVLRKRILGYLKDRLSAFDVGIYNVEIAVKDDHLVKLLGEIERSGGFQRFEKKHRNVVFSIMGIERAIKRKDEWEWKTSRIYQNLNLYRDFFVETEHPVMLWVNDAVASEISVSAPDFWRARTKVVHWGILTDWTIKEEKTFFERIKSDLLKNERFKGKFVAVLGRRVVDFDEDEKELVKRMYKKYGYIPFYVKKVEEEETVEEIPSPFL